MQNQAEKSSAWSALLLMLLVLLVAGYAVQFGLQTLTWAQAKRWAGINPWLNDVPRDLPPPSAPAAKGTQVKTYAYEFVAPWSGLKLMESSTQVAASLNFASFHFDSGQVVVFFDPDAQLDTLRSLRNGNPPEYQKFMNVFAEHPIDSNYEMYKAVYSASPAQLAPFQPRRDAMRINALLIWKLSFGEDTGSGIYSFDFGRNRGFQFGDPSKGAVAARVFDDRGHQFRFIFAVAAGSQGKITQDDIDHIIQSLEPIPIPER